MEYKMVDDDNEYNCPFIKCMREEVGQYMAKDTVIYF